MHLRAITEQNYGFEMDVIIGSMKSGQSGGKILECFANVNTT